MRRGFTLLEVICAVALLGIVSVLAFTATSAITSGWDRSTAHMDRVQRSDYALGQVVSAVRSMYYPRGGQQSYDYGFYLEDNGDGDTPDRSDVLQWSRLAAVGSRDKAASTVHRIQLMMLEEGDTTYGEPAPVTGLYMRRRPDVPLAPKGDMDDEYGFDNEKLYEPMLVADGICGFSCRVMKEPDTSGGTARGANDESLFEETWDASNAVPYKVELKFMLEDPERGGSRSDAAPVMRIVRIPVWEQSQDGAAPPSDGSSSGGRRGGGGVRK
jgi:prepilin-type N-terminal cleavage/methylation domain-containing protein